MTRTIQFTKIHGVGNDYIYADTPRFPIRNPGKTAIEWSTCHTGIGSNGLALIGHSDKADFSMRTPNADGSEAMMCGNASRCIGKYPYEYELTSKNITTLVTLSGIKVLKLHLEAQAVKAVVVDMGVPLETGTTDFDNKFPLVSTQVSMGSPHFVTFVDDIRSIDLPEIGPKLERYPLFPDRTNAELVQITGENKIRMRVRERGSGVMQAYGTGAYATTVAAHFTGWTGRTIDIVMDGGMLIIKRDEATNHVYMIGPAVKVFDGIVELRE